MTKPHPPISRCRPWLVQQWGQELRPAFHLWTLLVLLESAKKPEEKKKKTASKVFLESAGKFLPKLFPQCHTWAIGLPILFAHGYRPVWNFFSYCGLKKSNYPAVVELLQVLKELDSNWNHNFLPFVDRIHLFFQHLFPRAPSLIATSDCNLQTTKQDV